MEAAILKSKSKSNKSKPRPPPHRPNLRKPTPSVIRHSISAIESISLQRISYLLDGIFNMSPSWYNLTWKGPPHPTPNPVTFKVIFYPFRTPTRTSNSWWILQQYVLFRKWGDGRNGPCFGLRQVQNWTTQLNPHHQKSKDLPTSSLAHHIITPSTSHTTAQIIQSVAFSRSNSPSLPQINNYPLETSPLTTPRPNSIHGTLLSCLGSTTATAHSIFLSPNGSNPPAHNYFPQSSGPNPQPFPRFSLKTNHSDIFVHNHNHIHNPWNQTKLTQITQTRQSDSYIPNQSSSQHIFTISPTSLGFHLSFSPHPDLSFLPQTTISSQYPSTTETIIPIFISPFAPPFSNSHVNTFIHS